MEFILREDETGFFYVLSTNVYLHRADQSHFQITVFLDVIQGVSQKFTHCSEERAT